MSDQEIRDLDRSTEPQAVIARRRAKARAGKLPIYVLWPRVDILGESDGCQETWRHMMVLSKEDAVDLHYIGFDAFLRNTPICIMPYRIALAALVKKAVLSHNNRIEHAKKNNVKLWGDSGKRVVTPDLDEIRDVSKPVNIPLVIVQEIGAETIPGVSMDGAYGEIAVVPAQFGLNVGYEYTTNQPGIWPVTLPTEERWTLTMDHKGKCMFSCTYPYHGESGWKHMPTVNSDLHDLAQQWLLDIIANGKDPLDFAPQAWNTERGSSVDPMSIVEM